MKGIQDELNVTSISTQHLLSHLISARENILCIEAAVLDADTGWGSTDRGGRGGGQESILREIGTHSLESSEKAKRRKIPLTITCGHQNSKQVEPSMSQS